MIPTPGPNPFEFDLDSPPKPRPKRPWPRHGWVWALAAAGGTLLLGLALCLARVEYLDRTHRGPVVGRWVYAGPPPRERNALDMVLIVMSLGAWGFLTEPSDIEKPGWTLELRDDGSVHQRGEPRGRWRAIGLEEGWILVRVSNSRFESEIWKFRPEPAGKLTWKPVENGRPMPLKVAG